MTVDSIKTSNKYFCNKCKDKNFLIKCACGFCKEIIFKRDKQGRKTTFKIGHINRGQQLGITYNCKNCLDRNWLIECKCKCGDILSRTDERYRPRKYKYGHWGRQNKGINSIFWRGGRTQLNTGYWTLLLPDYFSSDKYGHVLEHVYVFQEFNKCCMLK